MRIRFFISLAAVAIASQSAGLAQASQSNPSGWVEDDELALPRQQISAPGPQLAKPIPGSLPAAPYATNVPAPYAPYQQLPGGITPYTRQPVSAPLPVPSAASMPGTTSLPAPSNAQPWSSSLMRDQIAPGQLRMGPSPAYQRLYERFFEDDKVDTDEDDFGRPKKMGRNSQVNPFGSLTGAPAAQYQRYKQQQGSFATPWSQGTYSGSQSSFGAPMYVGPEYPNPYPFGPRYLTPGGQSLDAGGY